MGPAYESDYYDNGYGYSDAYDPGPGGAGGEGGAGAQGGEAVAGPDGVGADLRQQDSTGQGPGVQGPESAAGGQGGGGGGGAAPQYRTSGQSASDKKQTGGTVSYEPAGSSKVIFVAEEPDEGSSVGSSAGTPAAYRSSQGPDQGERQQPLVPAVSPAAQALQDRVAGLLQGSGVAMGLWGVGSANASVAQRLAERAGAAATRLANTTAEHAGQAWQLVAEAAALRAEAVMRVGVLLDHRYC